MYMYAPSVQRVLQQFRVLVSRGWILILNVERCLADCIFSNPCLFLIHFQFFKSIMATAATRYSYTSNIGPIKSFVPLIVGINYEQQLDIEYFSAKANILGKMKQLHDMVAFFDKQNSHENETAIWLKGLAFFLSSSKMLGESFPRWGVSQTDVDSWLGGRPPFEDVTDNVIVDNWYSDWVESETMVVVDRGAEPVGNASSGVDVCQTDVHAQCEVTTGTSLLTACVSVCTPREELHFGDSTEVGAVCDLITMGNCMSSVDNVQGIAEKVHGAIVRCNGSASMLRLVPDASCISG